MMAAAILANGLNPVLIGVVGIVLILVLSITLVIIVLIRRRRKKVEPPSEEMFDVAQRLAESSQGAEGNELSQSALRAALDAQQPPVSPRSKILA
jgi:membrane protein implicated in regulation of membrane protease activity